MRKRKEISEVYKTYIKTSAAGLEVGLSVMVAAGAGYLFDGYFDTQPWGLIFGFIVGVLTAARRLYAFTKEYLKDNEANDQDKKPDA